MMVMTYPQVVLKSKTGQLLVRFLAVGFLNTVFGYSCFAVFLYAGVHYALALLLATLFGVLFNFKSIGVLVFKSHNNRLIFRFVAVYVFVYGVNVTLLKLLYVQGVGPYYGGAVLIMPMALLAFFLNRKFVFFGY
jgi:putative flippase GtrA